MNNAGLRRNYQPNKNNVCVGLWALLRSALQHETVYVCAGEVWSVTVNFKVTPHVLEHVLEMGVPCHYKCSP